MLFHPGEMRKLIYFRMIMKLLAFLRRINNHNMNRTLNTRQTLYLKHPSHNLKCGSTFYELMGGGAGVGKSRLISANYQSVN